MCESDAGAVDCQNVQVLCSLDQVRCVGVDPLKDIEGRGGEGGGRKKDVSNAGVDTGQTGAGEFRNVRRESCAGGERRPVAKESSQLEGEERIPAGDAFDAHERWSRVRRAGPLLKQVMEGCEAE